MSYIAGPKNEKKKILQRARKKKKKTMKKKMRGREREREVAQGAGELDWSLLQVSF